MAESPKTSYSPTAIDLQAVYLFNSEGRWLDITPVLMEFNIYEDIFFNFMRADITLTDSLGLPSNFPIIGEEKVAIQFKSPLEKETQQHIFYVYALENRHKNKEKNDFYTLSLCSPEYLKNFNQEIESAYTGVISDIVNKVYAGKIKLTRTDPAFTSFINKDIFVDSTQGSNYFAPYNESPFAFLNMLARYAGSFLFYENYDGFHFKNINNLVTQEPFDKFIYAEFNVEQSKDRIAKGLDNLSEANHIIQLEINKEFDSVDNISNGMFSQKVHTIDPIRKIYNIDIFNYLNEYNSFNHLSKNQVITASSHLNERSGHHLEHIVPGFIGDYRSIYSVINNTNDRQLYNATKQFQVIDNRYHTLQRLSYCPMNLTLPGNSTLRSGQVIEVLIPMNSAYKEDSYKYEIKFGQEGKARFLITALTHSYNNLEKRYITQVQACKDSFAEPIDKMLKIARGNNNG